MPPLSAAQHLRDQATRSLLAAKMPGIAALLRYRNCQITTLASLLPLVGQGLVPPHLESAILQDRGGPNPLDDEDNWDTFFHQHRPLSVADMAAAFEEIVWPTHRARCTRAASQRLWSLVVTWCLAYDTLAAALPMQRQTFSGLTWDLLSQGCSATYISTVWSAIRERHEWAGYAPPCSPEHLRQMHKAIAKFRGRAARAPLKCPVMKDHVQAALRVRSLDFVVNRNRLLMVVATVCALRASEVVGLQVCDLWFEFDARAAVDPARYKDTILVYVRRRKNDQFRRGHGPRIGRAVDPRLCITTQLRAYMQLYHLLPHPKCTRQQSFPPGGGPDARMQDVMDPGTRCPHCQPLFPKSIPRGSSTVPSPTPMPRQMATECLREALAVIGVDASQFSSVSARKGGISVASLAGVPEWAVCLQSGHAQNPANRAYINARASAYMYATWAAFDL